MTRRFAILSHAPAKSLIFNGYKFNFRKIQAKLLEEIYEKVVYNNVTDILAKFDAISLRVCIPLSEKTLFTIK